jgi:alkylhydroperoxidase family enzyme
MLKFLARLGLKSFSKRYGYDVGYMRYMLDASPSAFFKFAKLTALARHNEVAPRDAFFTAKLVGAIAEDCGPCVQLVVNMSREAGVAADQIEAVLKRDRAAMNADTALGFQFADAVVRRAPSADEVRETVSAEWGDAGVVDLALAVQAGRIYPMVKRALGFAKTCARVRIDDAPVDVVKEAA